MRVGALQIKVVQAGNGLLLDTMGRILADYGFSVIKTADPTAEVGYQPDIDLDTNKVLLTSKLFSPETDKHIRESKALFLHEDFPKLSETVDRLASSYPHLLILVTYRFTPSVSQQSRSTQPHDANIQSLASILSQFGQTDNPVDNTPQYPSVIATLVGANAGAITLATHLYNLEHQGSQPAKPKILRFSVLHANMYLNSFNLTSHLTGMTKATRGKNILDGAAPFYRIYRTLDHYITVGNIEAKFYAEMIAAMKFPEQRSEYLLENQMNEEEWPKMKEILQEEFSKKTTEEWIGIFSKYDTCVSKVEQLPEPKLNEPWPRLSRHNKEPRSKL